jgi:hypothetical protein
VEDLADLVLQAAPQVVRGQEARLDQHAAHAAGRRVGGEHLLELGAGDQAQAHGDLAHPVGGSSDAAPWMSPVLKTMARSPAGETTRRMPVMRLWFRKATRSARCIPDRSPARMTRGTSALPPSQGARTPSRMSGEVGAR